MKCSAAWKCAGWSKEFWCKTLTIRITLGLSDSEYLQNMYANGSKKPILYKNIGHNLSL